MMAVTIVNKFRHLLFVGVLLPLNLIAVSPPHNFHPSGNTVSYTTSGIDGISSDLAAKTEPIIRKYCKTAGLSGLPGKITLIALKNRMEMELWFEKGDSNKFVRIYKIRAASGSSGPKLRKGDLQVPEGIYRINVLNPYSKYHLSMGIDYPNEFDRRIARAEGRTNLGGDIYIHGGAVSSGCLAIGNAAIEELYYLVSRVGKDNVKVIIAPHDFRKTGFTADTGQAWIADLYKTIHQALKSYIR